MARHYRYTFDSSLPPWTTDASHAVQHGSELPPEAISLPPCAPTKIVCVGRNYVEHAKELGNEVPAEPLLFMKPTTSLIGHLGSIVYPAVSSNVHFEGELGVIISRRSRRVPASSALDYVRGYTCLNDVTARDLQRKDVQFTRGKGFDTFCATGPCFATPDDFDLASARVTTRLDGVVKQDGPITDMIFSIEVLIEFITRVMTLEPGDLIATGTPPGVGPMLVGSQIEVEVSGIGLLSNQVVQEVS